MKPFRSHLGKDKSSVFKKIILQYKKTEVIIEDDGEKISIRVTCGKINYTDALETSFPFLKSLNMKLL